MTCKLWCGAIAILCAASSVQSTSAAILSGSAYEPFDYAAGSQIINATGLNGGRGWNANGDNSPNAATANWGNAAALPAVGGTGPAKTVTTPTLNFAAVGYPAGKGGKATIDATLVGGNGQTNNVSRLIGGQLIDSGTLYFSYLTKRNNDTLRTTSLSFFGPAVGTTAPANRPERLAIGQIGTAGATDSMTNGNIGLFFNNGPQPAGVVNAPGGTEIAYGTDITHLIVGRIDWNAAGNETVTLWVDPADVTSEPVVPYIQTSAFELTSINSIRLFSGNLAAAIVGPPAQPAKPAVSADFDEIRLGTTWDSVIIPEPSALALTLMSAALLGGLRRRQA